MIDQISMIYYYLNSLGIFTIEQILAGGALLIVCRGFYTVTYVLNYSKDYNQELEGGEKLFTQNKSILFGLEQIVVVIIGMLYLPLAAFISFYSLLLGGNYLKEIGTKRSSEPLKTAGVVINVVGPLIGILGYIITEDYLATAAIGLGILTFLHHGQKSSTLKLSTVFQKNLQRFNRMPKGLYIGFLVILLIVPSIVLLGAAIYAPSPKQTHYIVMRDGIKLATDVYLAPGSFGGSRPVILSRTSYGKDGMGAIYGLLYLTQGYHLVIQDIRGCYDSEDHDDFIMFQQAYTDGVDTINWILDQSWCNGKIASIGLSALAINQFFYAGMNPTGLACQSLMIGTPDLYKISVYPGGALKESLVLGWLEGTADNYEYQLQQIISHPKKEDSYYNSTSLFLQEGPNFGNVNVPAIHIGGWYDVFQQGTLDGFIGYDDLGLNAARGKQLLIMGPFTHGFPGEGMQGEIFYPTKSKSGFDLYLGWEQKLFDHVLSGKEFDWNNEYRVAYYMMGDNTSEDSDVNDFRYAYDWPVPHEDDHWYFSADNELILGMTGLANTNYSYLYDPRDPVPTLGGTNLIIPAGPYDQRSVENRDDVLIFESPPLTSKVEVVGQIWAHLWVMSNCTNTDFTVKITDVYPDGRSMLLADGIINMVRRDGFDLDAPPLNPGEPENITIDLWSTAYQFDSGHRIRITISSSNYPRFAINPNTGVSPELYYYKYLDHKIANNTILVGSDYPSHIILPRPT
ncbi:MAG: CocE/NonD family hydrolase [Candidatus Heimdallarchaeota archaeon]|nr:MAG: CocE/NonD family hydrolase [Candidatus Heimdallarchaeota archaeon]